MHKRNEPGQFNSERQRQKNAGKRKGEEWKDSFFPEKQAKENQPESWVTQKHLQAHTQNRDTKIQCICTTH